FQIIPLLALEACVLLSIPILASHRIFFTTIDVRIAGYHRFEIPSVPTFFDLRNPRVLKLIKFRDWKPTIHLDNRYRLMRNEPMLDANGRETDRIGEDDGAPPILE
ncbi:uncharacterized protein LOC143429923, partial [Xylocopa sonorina]|uniref:uncharacterized protein LOC143429923 n=1 Tax=Xylocopa sonorina TaxID=1818115 RepID=UPI00403A98EB